MATGKRIPINEARKDSAGRVTAAVREQYAYADQFIARAEMAGLDTSEWYREACEDIIDLRDACNGQPTRAVVDRMFADCIKPIELGLEEAGIDPDGLVPTLPHLFDLILRTKANAGDED